MNYIKTFESYLESGRAPLYHFTSEYSLRSILNNDILKTGMSIEDNFSKDTNSKHRNRTDTDISDFKNKVKSISFTRLSSLSSFGSIRVRFDVDKLKRNYKIFKIDEVGTRIVDVGSPSIVAIKYNKYKKMDIHHNLPNLDSETKGVQTYRCKYLLYTKILSNLPLPEGK